MSDTPRTLEILTKIMDEKGSLADGNAPFVWVRLSKQLERELNAAKAENEAMCEAIENANKQLEKYGKSAVSHQGYSMCPHCNCIGVFDESHKDDCEIGSAIAKLQHFIK